MAFFFFSPLSTVTQFLSAAFLSWAEREVIFIIYAIGVEFQNYCMAMILAFTKRVYQCLINYQRQR
jgi:hypothetical protein